MGRRRALDAVARPGFPLATAAFALAIYLFLAWVVLGTAAVWSPDTGAKIMQVNGLRVEAGDLRWDLIYPGRELDPELLFADETPVYGLILRVHEGQLFLRRLPILPTLVWPLYRLWGNPALPVLPALCGAAVGGLTLLLVPAADRRWWMWGLVAWASPVAIYSTLFWEHTLATVLALAGVVLALRPPPMPATVWGCVGLLLAASVYTRQEVVLFASAFLAAVVLLDRRRRRGALLAGTVVAGASLLLPVLQSLLFDDPVPQNATHLIRPLEYLSEAGWQAVPALLVGPATHGAPDTGWVGVLWAWSAIAAFALGWWPARRPWALPLLATTAVTAGMVLFHANTYPAAHGLLLTTPWVAWAFYRSPDLMRGGGRARLLAVSALLGVIAYAVAILVFRGSTPDGGREWGARFALSLFPLFAVLAAWPAKATRRHDATPMAATPMAATVATLLFALGIGFQIRGWSTIRQELKANQTLNQTLTDLPESRILTDIWWLALNAAPAAIEKPIFIVNDEAELAEWLRIAREAGVETFHYVTLAPRLPAALAPLARAAPVRQGPYQFYSLRLGGPESTAAPSR